MKEDKIIVTVTDDDFHITKKEINNPTIRYASRGILIDSLGNIAIINKKIKNEYKLPGGGIEDNENKEAAFLREIEEETGCVAEITDYLGIAVELKSLSNFKQISYVYVAKVVYDTKKLHLTKKELDEKTNVLWTNLDNGINLIKDSLKNIKGSSYDSKYRSIFMVKRDELILEYFKDNYYK